MNNPKIALGVAYYDSIKPQTCFSLLAAVRAWPGDMEVIAVGSSYTHWNREKIVARAVESDCDYLWFVDTDVVFPFDGLARLVALDKDIVGGWYNLRADPPRPAVRVLNSDKTVTLFGPHRPEEPFTYRGLIVPTGFMLIKMSVFARMKPPYFETVSPIGDDTFFCHKAMHEGIQVWCEPRIEIGHIGAAIY